MVETHLRPGEEYRTGSEVVRVTTPRLPCFKLAAKFCRDRIERFLRSGFSSCYFSVAEQGTVSPGDLITLLKGDQDSVTITELNQLYVAHAPGLDLLRHAVPVAALPESRRQRFLSKPASVSSPRAI